jgi:large subunit ribosomal protein L1
MSFGADQLAENLSALMETLVRLKPASAKGTYIKSLTISGTMTPGVRLDPASAIKARA